VSGATVSSTFGHAFTEEYEDARKMRVERQHNIFALARTGYEALFKLKGDDAKYVATRTAELHTSVKEHGGISIAMHVRHGDKHPMEYQYQKDYIPLARYMDIARDIYIDVVEGAGNNKKLKRTPEELFKRHSSTKMILASDDPTVYEAPELSHAIRAQDRIVLATKAALEAAQSTNKKNNWIDEITGWEGGFFTDVFFSLGQSVGNAQDVQSARDAGKDVPEQARSLRELVGRAYLLDLAVLGQSDAVVCTVSSTSCRLLAVMVGWEEGIMGGKWRNIDGEFDWRGIMW
jgi:hypothetical protein